MRKLLYAALVAALVIVTALTGLVGALDGSEGGFKNSNVALMQPSSADVATQMLDNSEFKLDNEASATPFSGVLLDVAADPALSFEGMSLNVSGTAAKKADYYVQMGYTKPESSSSSEKEKEESVEESKSDSSEKSEEKVVESTVKVPSVSSNEIAELLLSRKYTSGINVFQSEANDIPTDLSALEKAVSKGNNTCGFVAIRLTDGASIAYNVDKKFDCASTIKGPVALYAYKQAQAGEYSLSTKLTYSRSDYYGGSGIIKSSAYGTKYSLKQVVDYSIRYSDNAAYIMLRNFISNSGFASMLEDLGCPNSSEMENNWPEVTALDAALWWNEIYEFCSNGGSGKELFKVFTEATNDSINKALGGQYTVAHKSGSKSRYFHDGGIVMADEPYLLVIYSYNPYVGSDNYSYIAPVIREIDKLINN